MASQKSLSFTRIKIDSKEPFERAELHRIGSWSAYERCAYGPVIIFFSALHTIIVHRSFERLYGWTAGEAKNPLCRQLCTPGIKRQRGYMTRHFTDGFAYRSILQEERL